MGTIGIEGMGIFLTLSAGLMICVGGMAYRMFPRQPLQALLSFITLFAMVISVLQLMLGGLRILNSIALFSSTIAFIVGVTFYIWRQPAPKDNPHAIATLNNLGWGVMIGGSLLLSLVIAPVRSVLSDAWMQMRLVHILGWDVVSYHLPNAIHYLQAQTWWSLQGTYGHYPGGNELLNLWSLIPLKSEAMLGVTTGVLFLGSLLGLVIVLNLVVPLRSPVWRGIASLSLVFGLLSIPEFNQLLFDVARNDVTMLFWETVILWSFLRSKTRMKNWALITGIALGLLIGTKPNGLYFLLGTLALNLMIQNAELRERFRDRVRSTVLQVLLPSLLLGSGWYVRNLVQTGQLTPPDQLKAAADLSIAQSLSNPALYQLNSPTLWLLAGILSSSIVLILGYLRRPKPEESELPGIATRFTVPLGIQIVASWTLLASLALILTPSGAGYLLGSGKSFLIQIRYSAIVIPLTLILILYGLSVIFDRALQPKAWMDALEQRQIASPSKLSIAIVGSVVFFWSIAQIGTYRTPEGLPGYHGIFFSSFVAPTRTPAQPPDSQIYAWVQKNIRNATIYSIGLRPYGLLGEQFGNIVIDRLGSSGWTQEEAEQVIQTRMPQYIAVCLDPFDRSIPPGLKPLLQQENRFEVVYRDPLSIVLRIKR